MTHQGLALLIFLAAGVASIALAMSGLACLRGIEEAPRLDRGVRARRRASIARRRQHHA